MAVRPSSVRLSVVLEAWRGKVVHQGPWVVMVVLNTYIIAPRVPFLALLEGGYRTALFMKALIELPSPRMKVSDIASDLHR